MKKITILVLCVITLCCSCHNFSAKLQGLMALKGKIEEKYNVKNVSININKENDKSFLKVSLSNTPYNDSPETVKQTIADSIGALCVANLPAMKFDQGSVAFAQETNMGVLKTSDEKSYDMHIGK